MRRELSSAASVEPVMGRTAWHHPNTPSNHMNSARGVVHDVEKNGCFSVMEARKALQVK